MFAKKRIGKVMVKDNFLGFRKWIVVFEILLGVYCVSYEQSFPPFSFLFVFDFQIFEDCAVDKQTGGK